MCRRMKCLQLVLINALTGGLEICVAACITYVPPLLLESGVEERYMTMVLGIGPILALLFVPLLSALSDRWVGSYGRRRPFIIGLSFGVLLGLLAILISANDEKVWLLILGVALLDFCGQACFTPLEALLFDLQSEGHSCTHAYAAFTFMVGAGGCVGYLLPSLDWTQTPLASYCSNQVHCLFSVLVVIILLSLVVTVIAAYPGPALPTEDLEVHFLFGCVCLCAGLTLCLLAEVYGSYIHMPSVLLRLFLAQLSSWMALETFMLFYTDFMGEGLYGGVPSATIGSAPRYQFDEGVRMGSWGLFLQSSTAMFCSAAMDRLITRFGNRKVYLAGLVCFTVAMLVMCFTPSVPLVTAMAALTGFTLATVQTIPYILATLYHQEKEVSVIKRHKAHANSCMVKQSAGPLRPELLPAKENLAERGICLDLAILDSACLLSQIVPSLCMGTIVELSHSVRAYVTCASLLGFVSIFFSTHVHVPFLKYSVRLSWGVNH
uniref:Zgc:77158 n=1 Tax=Eptatretus burgeri TaxID=7764 RepID=A0A8C4QWD3_EPTBU